MSISISSIPTKPGSCCPTGESQRRRPGPPRYDFAASARTARSSTWRRRSRISSRVDGSSASGSTCRTSASGAARGAAAAGPEDAVGRTAGGRRGPRLQQHPPGDLRPARPGPARCTGRQGPRRSLRRDRNRRRKGGLAHAAAARLLRGRPCSESTSTSTRSPPACSRRSAAWSARTWISSSHRGRIGGGQRRPEADRAGPAEPRGPRQRRGRHRRSHHDPHVATSGRRRLPLAPSLGGGGGVRGDLGHRRRAGRARGREGAYLRALLHHQGRRQGHRSGLSTAYGIVAQHGGGIDLESTPGRGATFSVYMPLIAVRRRRARATSFRPCRPGRASSSCWPRTTRGSGERWPPSSKGGLPGAGGGKRRGGLRPLRRSREGGRRRPARRGHAEDGRPRARARLRETRPALPLCLSLRLQREMLDAKTHLPEGSGFLASRDDRRQLLGAIAVSWVEPDARSQRGSPPVQRCFATAWRARNSMS